MEESSVIWIVLIVLVVMFIAYKMYEAHVNYKFFLESIKRKDKNDDGNSSENST